MTRRLFASLALVAFLCVGLSFSPPPPGSATYYVDYTLGDDTNAGTEAAPWKYSPGMGSYAATELVSNGGFASATTGWTVSDCTIASVAGGQSGNCLEITRTGESIQYCYQNVPVTVGHTYQVSCYVKSGTSGNESFAIHVYDFPPSLLLLNLTGTSSGSWVAYTGTFTATTDYCHLQIRKVSTTAGTMLFDTVSLSVALGPGDTVLLKRGETWRETLTVPSSGSAGLPITFGAYGTGDDPIISGADLVTSWITEAPETNHVYKDDASLAALWLMEEASGNRADYTPNANTLTDQNTVTSSATAKEGAKSASFARATSEYLWRTQATSTSFNNKTNLSCCFWFQIVDDATATFTSFVDTDKDGFEIYYSSPGNIACSFGDGTTRVADTNRAAAIDTGTWYHYAFTFDGATGNAILYIDGLKIGATITSTVTKIYQDTGATPFVIGVYSATLGNRFHNGLIDEAAIFTRTLSALEIASIAANGIEAPRVSPQSYYATAATDPFQAIYDGTRLTEVSTKAALSTGEWWFDDPNNRIYIFDDPSDHVVEKGRDNCIVMDGKSFITIQDLDLEGGTYNAIQVNNVCDTIIISDNTIKNSYGCGIILKTPAATQLKSNFTIDGNTISYCGASGVIVGNYSDTITISNNDVSHCSQIVDATDGELQYSAGIHACTPPAGPYEITNLIIERNSSYSHNQVAQGIGIWADTLRGSGNIIRQNFIWDTGYAGIFGENSSGLLIVYNKILFVAGSAGGYGIILHTSLITLATQNNGLYNNVIYGSEDIGILIDGAFPITAAMCLNNIIKNNISTGNTNHQLSCRFGGENDGTNGSGNVYLNNCFGTQATGFIEWGSGILKATYDLWETAYGATTSSVETDPLMTDPATGDFTLQPTSPCINAGTDVGLTTDYAGNPIGDIIRAIVFQPIRLTVRPVRDMPDIGAYEYKDH